MNADSYNRIEPYMESLKIICRKLAPNLWDAEDLMQETLLKLNRSLQQSPDRMISKAYIQRIATNAWIDHSRRKQAVDAATPFDETLHQNTTPKIDDMTIREIFEQLAHRLNARQMVLVLMIDIFQFSAVETAKLLHTTIGAVKEGLKRARHRLKLLMEQEKQGNEAGVQHFIQKRESEAGDRAAAQILSKETFEEFLAGFRAGDPKAICRSYLSLTNHGFQVEKGSASGGGIASFHFTFRDPNGHLISFSQNI